MRKGDAVRVKLTSGDQVRMVVWEQLKSSVLVCRPEQYKAAEKSHGKPNTVEFSQALVTY